jgi:hypothetical protein
MAIALFNIRTAALSNLAYSVVRADAANSDAVDLFRSAMLCVVFGDHAARCDLREWAEDALWRP